MRQLIFVFSMMFTFTLNAQTFNMIVKDNTANSSTGNSGVIIVNPSNTGGNSCPGSMTGSPIVTRPRTTAFNPNSFMNGKEMINQVVREVLRSNSTSQRRIFKIN